MSQRDPLSRLQRMQPNSECRPPEPATDIAAAWRANHSLLVDLAYRILGDVGEAQDAVQEAFTRLARTDDEIADERAWLIVVTTRLCLDQVRSARARREQPGTDTLHEAVAPIGGTPAPDPADRVTLDDQVRGALGILLDRLSPAERVAFVLYEVFQVPFEEIAKTLGRSPGACRQLASRARAKVAGNPVALPAANRDVVAEFMRATTTGELDSLVAVLAPDVWGRAVFPDGSVVEEYGVAAVAATLSQFWAGATMVTDPAGTGSTLLAHFGRRQVATIDLVVVDWRILSIQVTVSPLALRHNG